MTRYLLGLLAFPSLLWVGLQGYQVWFVEVEGPQTLAPVEVMQDSFGLCLDTAAAMGCPGVYRGYAPGPVCERVGFWTCTGMFRMDYAWGHWRKL
jgi:hypothetical protein